MPSLTREQAEPIFNNFSESEKQRVAQLRAEGKTPSFAIRTVQSQKKGDTLRNVAEAETQAELLTAEPSMIQEAAAFTQGAADNLGLGLADEARGVLTAIPRLVPGGESPGDAYRRGRDAQREKSQDYQSGKVGAQYGAGDLAGTIGNVALGGANLKAASSLKAAAAQNTAMGGAAGFGAGEGGPESLFLGALGGLAGAGLTVLPGGAQAVRDRIGRTTAKEAREVPIVGKALKAFDLGKKPAKPTSEYEAMLAEQMAEGPLSPLLKSDAPPLPVDSGDILETLDVSRTMKLPDDLPSGKPVKARQNTPATPSRPEDALPARAKTKPERQAELDRQLAEAQEVVRARALAELDAPAARAAAPEVAPTPAQGPPKGLEFPEAAPLARQGVSRGESMSVEAFDDYMAKVMRMTPEQLTAETGVNAAAAAGPVGERTFSRIAGDLLGAAERPELWSAQKQVAAGLPAPTPAPGTKAAARAAALKHLEAKGLDAPSPSPAPKKEPGGFAVKRAAKAQKKADAPAVKVADKMGVGLEDAQAFRMAHAARDPRGYEAVVNTARARGLSQQQMVELAYRFGWPEAEIRRLGLL
jgi:hypothetical protein